MRSRRISHPNNTALQTHHDAAQFARWHLDRGRSIQIGEAALLFNAVDQGRDRIGLELRTRVQSARWQTKAVQFPVNEDLRFREITDHEINIGARSADFERSG